MKQEVQFLLEIIKYYLNKNDEISFEKKNINWEELFSIAIGHNVLNFVYYYVEEFEIKKQLKDEVYQHLFRTAMYEMTKSYNQIYAADELLDAFEKQGVYALAVKGICAKYYYPQYDMRSMGDIDILYQPSQQQKVKRVMKMLEYNQSIEGRKHDYYIREPFIVVEMHRDLVSVDSEYYSYYQEIWNRLKLKENHHYVYQMSLEEEFIYSFIHLVEHFRQGGIGIRFVMDIYVYHKMDNLNWDYIEKELRRLKLWEFYKNISILAKKWFGVGERDMQDEFINRLSEHVISQGTFGSRKNSASLAVASLGRNRFMLQALFPNFQSMQSMFPWLKRYPFLLPYSWMLRGVKSILFRREHIKTQLHRYKYGDKNYGDELKEFYKSYGL